MSQAELAVMAKIRSRYGSFLTAGDYRQLSQCAGVHQIASSLAANPLFTQSLANVREGLDHRGNLEELLKKAMYENLADMCRFDAAVGSDLYTLIVKYIEINIVLTLYVYGDTGKSTVLPVLIPQFFRDHINLDFSAAASSGDIKDRFEQYRGLSIYPALKLSRPVQMDNTDFDGGFSRLENTLYRYYYDELFKKAAAYDKTTASQLYELLGMSADIHNLKTLWRCRRYYPTAPAMLEKMMINHGMYLSDAKLSALCRADNSEFDAIIGSTRYKKAFSVQDDGRPVDIRLGIMLMSQAEKTLRFATGTPAVMAAYMMLLKIQYDNLTSVIEAVRYGLSSDRIGALLCVTEDR